MKKNILKKFFIKIAKALDFELIDQNEFKSPTLNKELNENLSNLKKSIVLPLGQVELTRKIKSLLIIFRTNTNVEMWNQNRKRIFDEPKIEYVCRSLYSVIRSIKYLNRIKISLCFTAMWTPAPYHKIDDVMKELYTKESRDTKTIQDDDEVK